MADSTATPPRRCGWCLGLSPDSTEHVCELTPPLDSSVADVRKLESVAEGVRSQTTYSLLDGRRNAEVTFARGSFPSLSGASASQGIRSEFRSPSSLPVRRSCDRPVGGAEEATR